MNTRIASRSTRRKLTIGWGAVAILVLASLPTRGDELPDHSWRETGTLAAPEAFQAAAADERYVYVVANREIAKYDRRSGARVAASRGEAEHLNSAFLWQRQLYCAHSNYPQQPELSQVKRLDLESMELTTFHDFDQFLGSLTWIVRHDNAWWCNFARYGEDKHLTKLVRFDDNWNEIGRWTYPDEVLRELGRHSLSGGVWRGQFLYVTGHDDRVVYRLRLPESGDVLESVDRQVVPFAGQGIAHDPLTGGLVGIERAKRRVVFARPTEPLLEFGTAQSMRLRVLSYNIHHGAGTDGALDLPRIARVITEVAPDLVALQEVDQGMKRTNEVDQPAELARLTGMHVVFGDNLAIDGGRYGNAVLSRLPVAQHQNHLLPSIDQGEQRGVLELSFELPGKAGALRLFATHLDARRSNEERMVSADAINRLVEREPATPALLAGDLNAVPASDVLRRFETRWSNTTPQPLATSPADKPRRQIDFVLCSPAARWHVVESRVLDEAVASDHRPLLLVLDLLPE